MRKTTLKKRITLGGILLLLGCCPTLMAQNSEKSSSSKEPAISMLRLFYSKYSAAFDLPGKQADSVFQKLKTLYCTPELLRAIKSAELDYDPLISAQDFRAELAQTMTFEKDERCQGCYRVAYSAYNKYLQKNESGTIFLHVVKTRDTYQIDNIRDFQGKWIQSKGTQSE